MCSPHRTAEELLNALYHHLAASGETASTGERFASFDSDLERVQYVSQVLVRFELLPRVTANCLKSDELSGEFRERGNRAFKAKRDREALELYTKSVAFAVEGSEVLGLAFANRSAVLFEKKLYNECLQVRKRRFFFEILKFQRCHNFSEYTTKASCRYNCKNLLNFCIIRN